MLSLVKKKNSKENTNLADKNELHNIKQTEHVIIKTKELLN